MKTSSPELRHKFGEQDIRRIEESLNRDVVHRASNMFFMLAVLFSIYGLMSTSIISQFNAEVNIWSNTWPRILFNGIPFALLGLYMRRSRHSSHWKSIVWAIAQPLIFVVACCIYVWPTMYHQQTEIYKYFHAANMFIITFGITFVAPSRTILFVHVGAYVTLFLTPLLYLTRMDSSVSSMVLNDFLCMTLGACVAGQFTFGLRKKVAFMDEQIKTTLTPFIGNTLASAIYSQNLETLNNRSSYGLVLTMDLRGYTQFMQNQKRELSSAFMKEYHFLVSSLVGKHNGFVHKTTGLFIKQRAMDI